MKLLVIDDHSIVLDGLAALLVSSKPGAIVLTAHDARDAFKLLGMHPDIDIILLDLRLPGFNGHEAITEFVRLRPDLPIIVLSSSEDPHDVRKAIALGALGYVPKSASRRTLMSAIDLAMNGEIYVPPLVVGRSDFGATPGERGAPNVPRLTDRQIEVLAMLSQGQANKTIAVKLNLSEKTVKIHISAIFKALNVVNRTQAAAVGRELGIV
jgi:two-component system, NarL family, nitrate/nitrite response regulator NarL